MTVSFNLNRVFNHLVCAFVAIGTFFYLPAPAGTGLDKAIEFGYLTQELFFRYGALIVIAFSFFMKPLRTADLKPLAIFALFGAFCALNFGFDIQSRRTVLNVFVALFFVKAVADYFSFEGLKVASYWLGFVLLFNLVMCLQQYFKIDPLFQIPANLGPKDAVVGFLKMKVHLGTLLAVISPIIFYASPLLALLAIPMLCVANSSAAVVSYALSMGFLILLRMKRLYAVLVLVLLLSGGIFYVLKFDLPGGQFSERFKVWNAVYGEGLKRNPFFGSGAGSYVKLNVTTVQKNGEPQNWTWAHNEYIQTFFEFGFIGLFLIGFYIKRSFQDFFNFWKDRKLQVIFASLVSVIGISFLHFPFHIARLAIPCLFVMGLFSGRVKDLEYES